MEPKTKRWLQFRSSITGRYCSAEYAAAHPDTTQSIQREQEPQPETEPNEGEADENV